MSPPNLNQLLGQIRQLNSTIRAGGSEAFPAFRELTSLLLNLTILAPGAAVKLVMLTADRTKAVLTGWNPNDPLLLNDGRYLRLSSTLYLSPPEEGNYLKVEDSSYQYQLDPEGRRWIFRYDYLRNPGHAYPPAHLQIRGTLAEPSIPEQTLLKDIHFPTGHISIEAVVRLLAEQFHVSCNCPSELWRRVLAESERDFLRVAHQPLSGPAE